jgi:nitrogen fixation protein NifU and related proteins
MSDLFTQIILDESKNPAHYGVLEGDHLKTVQYNPSCGDMIRITLKINDEKNTIEDLKWTGQGCSISMAAMSLLSQEIVGKPISQVLELTHQDMLKFLDLESITPGRLKCMTIGLSAVQNLISNKNNL